MIMKWFSQFRLFFICAVAVSAAVDIAHIDLFELPADQITISAVGGAIGLALAKLTHIV